MNTLLTPKRPLIELPLIGRETRCQKKFNLWTYCDGYCDRNGELARWECVPFSEYPYAQIMWKSTTPTGKFIEVAVTSVLLNFNELIDKYSFNRDLFEQSLAR